MVMLWRAGVWLARLSLIGKRLRKRTNNTEIYISPDLEHTHTFKRVVLGT
jgi:hypothetical protein